MITSILTTAFFHIFFSKTNGTVKICIAARATVEMLFKNWTNLNFNHQNNISVICIKLSTHVLLDLLSMKQFTIFYTLSYF